MSVTGGKAVKAGSLVVVSVVNVTLSSGVGRSLGTLSSGMRPSQLTVGTVNYQGKAGQLAVDAAGAVTAYSTSAGDFSGQVAYLV